MTDETFALELTAMAHGGNALGRYANRTIFVPYTIPGEVIEARITQERGRIAFAEGLRLIEASVDRVFPRCAHFGPGRCGRCHWQHIDYAAQLLLKQDVLADQLDRVGGFADADVRAVIPSPQPWGYNYHMTFDAGPDGTPGFARAGDGPPLAIEECHIIHPELLALYEALDLQFDGLQKLQLRLGSDGSPMLVLTMADDNAPELETDMPASVNMLIDGTEPVNLIGESHTRYTVDGQTFRVTAGSYFRANIAALPELVRVVRDAVAGSEYILDLYAGVGLFSAFLAPDAEVVTLVESFPPAVTDADDNLAAFENVDIVEGTVEDVLAEIDGSYDAAVIDPPGAGLSLEAVDALAALEIPRLVYVSSDPATLARDIKRLVGHGYELAWVQPLDLAPQTYFIDSVALLERAAGKE